MSGWLKSHGIQVAFAGALLVAGGVVGWLISRPPGSSPYIALPAEYVYLDSARVDTYLGQLQNGLATSEKQSVTHTGSKNASVTAGSALSIGGSVTDTQSTEKTVTPDEGDRLYQLLEDLHRQFSDRIHSVDLRSVTDPSGGVESIPEFHFVELRYARLAIPSYALPVPSLSLGVQTVLKGQNAISSSDLATVIADHPGEIQQYLKGFGAGAIFPLRVVSTSRGHVGILVPVLLSGLFSSSSLIAGDVTILGIVVRQIHTGAAARGPYQVEDTRYFDASSAVATERALNKIPHDLARVLDLPRDRTGINNLVNQSEALGTPGTVILPIAIYA
jgi:hypothetical protein